MTNLRPKKAEDILKQKYMNPQDLKVVIPSMSLRKCREHIDELRTKMEHDGYFVPEGKVKIALTEFVIDKFFRGNA